MATPEQVTAALLAAYGRSAARLTAQVVEAIQTAWDALTSWRQDDIERFVAQVTPIVGGAQQQVANLTAALLAQQRAAAGLPARKVAVPPRAVTGAAVRNGTPPADVYQRAGIQVWRDLAEGRPLEDAVAHGRFRAEQAARTDLELAKVHTARLVLSGDREVFGFRRVLVTEENCALCIVASSQRYHKGDLLPIHPGCDCSVEPLYDEVDDQVIDPDLLEAAHDAIMATFGISDAGAREPDYRKLILVREHGEFGPTLTVARHTFTGPEAIKSGLDLSKIPGPKSSAA